MITKTNLGLVEWAKSKVGEDYVYATYFGYVLTLSILQAKAEKYPNIFYRPWTLPDGTGTTYFEASKKSIGKVPGDCVGLIKGYYWFNPDLNKVVYKLDGRPDNSANGMFYAAQKMNGKTATENYNKTWGTMATMPNIPGILVRYNGHIAVYIGNRQVVEMRGLNYGGVITELSKRPWTNWCLCPYIEYEGDDMVYCQYGDGRETSTSSDPATKAMQAGLKRIGYIIVVDGRYGPGSKTIVANFIADNGLVGDGSVFDKDCIRVLLEKLETLATGITQEMLDTEKQKTVDALVLLQESEGKIIELQNQISDLDNLLDLKEIECGELNDDYLDIKASFDEVKDALKVLNQYHD